MGKAEILSKKRAENFNEQILNDFFEIYKTPLEDSGILEADVYQLGSLILTRQGWELILTRENYSSKRNKKCLSSNP